MSGLAKGASETRYEDLKYIKPSSIPEPTRSMLLSAKDGDVLPPATAAAAGSETITLPPSPASIARINLVLPRRGVDLSITGGYIAEHTETAFGQLTMAAGSLAELRAGETNMFEVIATGAEPEVLKQKLGAGASHSRKISPAIRLQPPIIRSYAAPSS